MMKKKLTASEHKVSFKKEKTDIKKNGYKAQHKSAKNSKLDSPKMPKVCKFEGKVQ